MNFTNIIGTISYLTCFKLLFILALFFLHLYLYFSEPKEYAIKECGLNDKIKIKDILSACSYYQVSMEGMQGIKV